MPVRDLFFLVLIVYISIINVSATDGYSDDEEDEYLQFKRFFFGPKSTSTTPLPSGACASNPCENGGICTPKGQMNFECKCIGPWRGIYCSIADACYKSPCENGGTCLSVHDDYWCKCTNDYYGKNCQTKSYSPSNLDNHCQPNICNTGRCVSLKTTYYCQCPDDRYGEHCEKRLGKRDVSKRESFLKFLKQMKRVYDIQSTSGGNKNDGRIYYDYKNGMYF